MNSPILPALPSPRDVACPHCGAASVTHGLLTTIPHADDCPHRLPDTGPAQPFTNPGGLARTPGGTARAWMPTTREGRARARVTATDPLTELESELQAQHPGLRNIHVTKATPTEDYDTRIQPHQKWYTVTYTADEE